MKKILKQRRIREFIDMIGGKGLDIDLKASFGHIKTMKREKIYIKYYLKSTNRKSHERNYLTSQ